jgi:glycosyltransferase involved in cell wall biosynthesis
MPTVLEIETNACGPRDSGLHGAIPDTAPVFSIIIAVYNDWKPLDRCLRSLARQERNPTFEVIVVDDGSRQTAPEFIQRWAGYFMFKIVRQHHCGVAAARNRGLELSTGAVLVFIDADCRVHKRCLSSLASTVAASPGHDCFQLHLVGDCSRLVGRAEELRLITLQDHLMQPNGCIRYLNTAGFAVRAARARAGEQMFDPGVRRAEDTLFLVRLMEAGELPLFVADAVVQHAIPLSLAQCLLKDIRSGYLGGIAYKQMAAKGVRIRIGYRERLRMLSAMWRLSRQPSIGRGGYFVLLARQVLERIVSWTAPYLFIRS